MKMHLAKTKYSIISTRQKIANSAKQSLDLSVDGMQLTKVASERVLGAYIDSKSSEIYTNQISIALYSASIKPLFTYCCTGWGNFSQTNLDKLFKLQKRCARSILDSPRDVRPYGNFQNLNWQPVDQLFKLNRLGL